MDVQHSSSPTAFLPSLAAHSAASANDREPVGETAEAALANAANDGAPDHRLLCDRFELGSGAVHARGFQLLSITVSGQDNNDPRWRAVEEAVQFWNRSTGPDCSAGSTRT